MSGIATTIGILDPFRVVLVAVGFVLVPLSIYCVVWCEMWDQRLRFLAVVGYGAVTVISQIDGIGRPVTGITILFATSTALALVGTAMYMVRARREQP